MSTRISFKATSCCAMKELVDISCGTAKEAIGTLCYYLRGTHLVDLSDTGWLGRLVGGSAPPLVIYTAVVGERKRTDHTHKPEGVATPTDDYVKSTTYAQELNDYIRANSLGTVVDGPQAVNPITGNTVQLFTFLPDHTALKNWWAANWNTLKVKVEKPSNEDASYPAPAPDNIIEVRELQPGEQPQQTPSIPADEVAARVNLGGINRAPTWIQTGPVVADQQPFRRFEPPFVYASGESVVGRTRPPARRGIKKKLRRMLGR